MNGIRLLIPAASLLVAACSPESTTTPPADLGAAVRHNMAVHIVPVPPSPASGTPTDIPGPRGDVLMERYMSGKVTPPAAGSGRAGASAR
jgi:hypothetical protein